MDRSLRAMSGQRNRLRKGVLLAGCLAVLVLCGTGAFFALSVGMSGEPRFWIILGPFLVFHLVSGYAAIRCALFRGGEAMKVTAFALGVWVFCFVGVQTKDFPYGWAVALLAGMWAWFWFLGYVRPVGAEAGSAG